MSGTGTKTNDGARPPRAARIALLVALATLVVLLVALDAPWHVEGGPGLIPPVGRPFAHTVQIGLFWAAALNTVVCLGLLATLRWWARPLEESPTPPTPARPGRIFWVGLLLATALAGALRWPVAHGSFWWDEGWSITRVVRGTEEPRADDPRQLELNGRHWARTVWYWKKPTNHVLYNIAGHASLDAWRMATGRDAAALDEFVFRLPAYAAALASIVGLGLLGWRWGLPWAGLGAASLLAIQPWAIRYSVDGRAYAFVVPLAIASGLFLTEALRSGAWRHWLGYGASQLLLLWAHPFMIYVTFCLGTGALLALLRSENSPRDRATLVMRLIVANLAAAVLFLQLMAPNLAQALVWDNEASGQPLSRNTVLQLWSFMTTGLPLQVPTWVDPAEFPSLAGARAWVRALVFGVLPLLGVLGTARILTRPGAGRVVWAALAITVPFSMTIVHLTGQLYYHRFMTFGLVALLPALFMGAEAFLRFTLRRAGRAGTAVATLGLALALAGTLALIGPQLRVVLTRPIAPLRDVGEYLRNEAGDDPLSVIRAGYGLGGGMPKIYDPWIQYIHTRAEVEALVRRASREGRPLYVFYGQEGMNRRRWPDGWALLDDPALFEENARFLGIEARFLYRVLRYTGAPLDTLDPES